jgi:hypothetical protein
MSQIEVNKINPATGTDLVVGDSGDTITITAGASLTGPVVASGLTGALPAISGASLTSLNATNLGSGTVPDARFPATLPVASGVNLTALNATNLGSGTLPDARFGTLPAVSGVNLTALDAANLGSNKVPTARLGTGTASSSTYLAGDQSYKALSEFNDDAILNDIGVLALNQAVANNKAAYNLANELIDQYEDSSAIENLTDVTRNASEYMGTITTATAKSITMNGDDARSSTAKVGSYSMLVGGTSDYTGIGDNSDFNFGTGDFTLEGWFRPNVGVTSEDTLWSGSSVSQGRLSIAYRGDGSPKYFSIGYYNGSSLVHYNDYEVDLSLDTWYHVALVGTGGTNLKMFLDGTQVVNETVTYNQPQEGFNLGYLTGYGTNIGWQGFIDEFRISNSARYSSSFSTTTTPFTPDANTMCLLHFENTVFVDDPRTIANATGSYTSTDQTANATVSNGGIVVLYKNASGTATLNTDLIAKISANGGTNYETVTLASLGTFSTGILMASAQDVTISNTGTAMKYKIEFANQASGSKETQVWGVAFQY